MENQWRLVTRQQENKCQNTPNDKLYYLFRLLMLLFGWERSQIDTTKCVHCVQLLLLFLIVAIHLPTIYDVALCKCTHNKLLKQLEIAAVTFNVCTTFHPEPKKTIEMKQLEMSHWCQCCALSKLMLLI